VTQLPEPKFALFVDKSGKFRFRLVAANGKTLAVSEAYNTKEDCLEATKLWKQTIFRATIESRIEEAKYVIARARALIDDK
jgi:uncharacterized protein YegP (UPF0339 family)